MNFALVKVLSDTMRRTQASWGHAFTVDYSAAELISCPGSPAIEVTQETTQDAALRFRGKRVAILNFASGRNPGGGCRRGSRAQEEDLCYCSGLLHSLEAQSDFYDWNKGRNAPQHCYDTMIWSANVPLIRNGKHQFVEPMRIQVITYPAPNLNSHSYGGASVDVADIIRRRTRHIVHKAQEDKTEVLVLGA